MEAVSLYGEELVRKRGAVLDSILFDDGWDNPETLWEFNEGFKHEFRNVHKLGRFLRCRSRGMVFSLGRLWPAQTEPAECRGRLF